MRKLLCFAILFLIFKNVMVVQNCDAQWILCNTGITTEFTHSFAQIGSFIFAGTDDGVFRTSNNGSNWTPTSLMGYGNYILATNGIDLFAGSNNGIKLSTDYGDTWLLTATISGVTSIIPYGNYLYVGTIDGFFVSTNDGNSWTQTWNYSPVTVFKAEGNYLFATLATSTSSGGVYQSINNGYNWSYLGLDGKGVHQLAVSGNNMYACTDYGLWISRYYGNNWEQSSFLNSYGSAGAIVVSGSNIIVDAPNIPMKNIYYSSNDGVSWVSINQGIENVPSQKLFIANGYVFAGTWGYGVKRRQMSQFIGIQNISTVIPKVYSLSQNYPNPFNPTTVIRFQLSVAGNTTLRVYDIMGREVQTLVNERLQAGTYEMTFDGGDLPSGTYFYKITSGEFIQTKKLTLIK